MDWRLDSPAGCNGLAPGGVVCGEVHPQGHGTALAGGGAGYHNSIALHTVCRKHVVVANGRVFDRGFRVNEGAMTLEASFTVPSVGRTVVLGFGGVRRRRPLLPAARLSDYPDDPFPVPDGVSFGGHPFANLSYLTGGATNSDRPPIFKDRRFATFYDNAAAAWPMYLADTSAERSMLFLRVDEHNFLRYDVIRVADLGASANPRYVYGVRVSRVDVLSRVAVEVARDEEVQGNAVGVLTGSVAYLALNSYKQKAFPLGNGEFLLVPAQTWAPHVRVRADAPLDFTLLPGTAFNAAEPDYSDFWELGGFPSSKYTSATDMNTNRPFRMHDGRFLVLPRQKTTSQTMYVFDPATNAIDRKDPYALGLFVSGTNGGASKWKAPVQIPSGTVIALPDTFPGNNGILYHPDTDTFERRIAAGYPRADVRHCVGQPTADGRVIYWQTYGAAADINSYLTVWPDELAGPDLRNEIAVLDGMVKSVVGPVDYGFTAGDGVMVFAVNAYGARGLYAETAYYTVVAVDPSTMDYELHTYPCTTTNVAPIAYGGYLDLDGAIHSQQGIVVTPEFDYLTFTSDGRNMYALHDAPAAKSMGAFFRQAYFGYCF
jgi:hypothetical protein